MLFYDFFVTCYDDVIATGNCQIRNQRTRFGRKPPLVSLSAKKNFGLGILKMKWFLSCRLALNQILWPALNNTIMTEPQLIFARSRSSEHDSDSEFPCILKRHFVLIRGKSLAIISSLYAKKFVCHLNSDLFDQILKTALNHLVASAIRYCESLIHSSHWEIRSNKKLKSAPWKFL